MLIWALALGLAKLLRRRVWAQHDCAWHKESVLKSVPIVMVTSRGEPANVETGYCSGCDAYLTKPIHARELLELVRMLLGEIGSPDSAGADPAVTEAN